MDFKVLKLQILHGSIARRMLLRVCFFALAIPIFPLLQIFPNAAPTELIAVNFDDCAINVGSNPYLFPGWFLKPVSAYASSLLVSFPSMPCKESVNFTIGVLRELMDNELLKSGAKALCVGEGSAVAVSALRKLGFLDSFGIDRHPFFSLMRKQFILELEFKDNSFDFIFSRALDRVSVPALLILEIERVLRPGGIGAMLVSVSSPGPGSLIKSAAPVTSSLKSSNVVHVRSINSFTLVVFKKRFDSVSSFKHYRLPDKCPSIRNNSPFIGNLEPIIEDKPVGIEGSFSYLPNYMNISSRKRFVYIDIGAGESMNSGVVNSFPPFYPIQFRAFDVYVVDYNATVLSSYVKGPGITFVYHPGLAENKSSVNPSPVEDLSMPMDDEGFNFLVWFKETVAVGDFVVLKMNAKGLQLKLLFELFETGGICLVDELFLHCLDGIDDHVAIHGDCKDLFKGLRSSGIFAHQW